MSHKTFDSEILLRVFYRWGAEGQRTSCGALSRMILELGPAVSLHAEEDVILVSASDDMFVVITNMRLIMITNEVHNQIYLDEVADCSVSIASFKTPNKSLWDRCVVTAQDGSEYIVICEPGLPFWGIFNIMNTAAAMN